MGSKSSKASKSNELESRGGEGEIKTPSDGIEPSKEGKTGARARKLWCWRKPKLQDKNEKKMTAKGDDEEAGRENVTTPKTPMTPNVPPKKISSQSLHYIKSKMCKFFNRGQTAPGTNTAASPYIGIVQVDDGNGNPIMRSSGRKPSSDRLQERSVLGINSKEASAVPVNKSPSPEMPTGLQNDEEANKNASPIDSKIVEVTSSASSGTSGSSTASSESPASPAVPKRRSNRTSWKSPRNVEPMIGCCAPTAPPAYLDYGPPRSSCGGGKTGNPILDRLKNVDVIEELKYHVPGGDCCGENDDEYEYFYCCDGCGEMEPCTDCEGVGSGSGKPVTYSRRQRFNFQTDEKDGNGLVRMPYSNACPCACCRAGLRRNPCCTCKCCLTKGRDRVTNIFDEIPVGKNPNLEYNNEGLMDKEFARPRPKGHSNSNSDDETELTDDMRADSCEDILPTRSGVYFFDAMKNEFIRQEPRTPTPVYIEETRVEPPIMPCFPSCKCTCNCSNNNAPQQYDPCEAPDLTQVVQCLPSLQRRRQSTKGQCRNGPAECEPVYMLPVYAGNCGMNAIAANLEATILGKPPPFDCCLDPCNEQNVTCCTDIRPPTAYYQNATREATRCPETDNAGTNAETKEQPTNRSLPEEAQNPDVDADEDEEESDEERDDSDDEDDEEGENVINK